MPYFKCKKCHHEWEGTNSWTVCDWCNTDGAMVLEEQTPFEKCVYSGEMEKVLSNFVTEMLNNEEM